MHLLRPASDIDDRAVSTGGGSLGLRCIGVGGGVNCVGRLCDLVLPLSFLQTLDNGPKGHAEASPSQCQWLRVLGTTAKEVRSCAKGDS